MTTKRIHILGTRGIPARHGGFETFAEYLALYLCEQGWDVMVYCQLDEPGEIHIKEWRGIHLVQVPVNIKGALGTAVFDWKSVWYARQQSGLILTLGYNTAIFCLLFRLNKLKNLINMDGIEWQRKKWSMPMRAWLYLNERAGCLLGDHLIADHPRIKDHLSTRVAADKITMIPYGAERIGGAHVSEIEKHGLQPKKYVIVVARAEPENSIFEIVSAFSRKRRGLNLVMVGNYMPKTNDYHRYVIAAASEEVKFIGAIYDKASLSALRFYAALYVHGHRVGGTNPSLVEALGAGNAVLAHDNRFNRWVAGEDAYFFADETQCARAFDEILVDEYRMQKMRAASLKRYEEEFTWQHVLQQYDGLLSKWVDEQVITI